MAPQTPGFSVRPGISDDIEACAEVHSGARAAWSFLAHEPHTRAETLDWMRHVVFATRRVWVALVQGEIAGYLSLDGDCVTGLYVAPDRQGRGIGTALLDLAKGEETTGLTLFVFEANTDAISLYERHGFETLSRTNGESNDERLPDRRMAWRATNFSQL